MVNSIRDMKELERLELKKHLNWFEKRRIKVIRKRWKPFIDLESLN